MPEFFNDLNMNGAKILNAEIEDNSGPAPSPIEITGPSAVSYEHGKQTLIPHVTMYESVGTATLRPRPLDYEVASSTRITIKPGTWTGRLLVRVD